MNARIDRDIQAQRMNIEQKKGRIADMKGILAETYRRTGNMDQAEALARAAVHQGLAESAVDLTSQVKSQQLKANADLVLADQRQKYAESREHYMKYVPAQTLMVGGAGGVGGAGSKGEKEPLLYTGPDGKTYKAQTPESYSRMTKKIGLVTDIQANLDEAKNIRKSASSADLLNPYSEASKRLASLAADTRVKYTVAAEQGAMSAGDAANADEVIGAMRGVLGSNDKVLDDTRRRVGEHMQREVNATGDEVVQRSYGTNTKGQTVPTPSYTGEAAQPKKTGSTVKKTPL
ncbi:MAG TPA: hypothetical protein VKE94_05545, partial [Gemmataceae bacterium]|nr:hypothetical protein [Gemmataceae bacterium]